MDEKNQRVVALYRASTKGQTSTDDNDIPTQKKIVRNFIHKQNWDIVREFTEGGVSGFSTPTENRDALNIIKSMALNKEFDILVVYMSDRIGRRKDETPLVIKFLYDNKIKVISATEGEIKNETHTDSLLTYIRYWQAEGESLKISQRVSDYMIAAVEEGRFRGGNCIPLGYQLVDNGSKNFKGKPIKDFVINPEEEEIVKLIYYLSTKMNYGQRRIAIYLNENGHRTRGGKPWKSSAINLILSNPIYKGQFRIHSKLYDKEIISPTQEHLIIIPEIEWEKNRKMVEARTNKKISDVTKNTKNTHGKLLLSGIIYCGHCNQKLTTFAETKKWKRKDDTQGERYSYRYRCMSFYKKGAIDCDGQSAYGCKKIDELVIKRTKLFLTELEEKTLNKDFLNNLDKKIKEEKDERKELQKNLNNIYKDLKELKEAIPKSLRKEIPFSPEMLNDLIKEKEIEITNLNNDMLKCEQKINDSIFEKDAYIKLDDELCNWEEQFDGADRETQKSMLFSIIERVIVFRNKIEIDFNISVKTYKENSTCINDHAGRVNQHLIQGVKYTRVVDF